MLLLLYFFLHSFTYFVIVYSGKTANIATVQILTDLTVNLHMLLNCWSFHVKALIITLYVFFAGTFTFCKLRKTFERAGTIYVLVLLSCQSACTIKSKYYPYFLIQFSLFLLCDRADFQLLHFT